jgi:hypothetical protein
MRAFLLFLSALPLGLFAQPGPPDITFTLAESRGRKPLMRPHQVEVRYRSMSGSGIPQEVLGTWTQWALQPQPLFPDTSDGWYTYSLNSCWCSEWSVRVIAGADTMQLDLPEANADRWALVQRAMGRWGHRETPEVIRFRPGRFAFADIITGPWATERADRFAERLQREAKRRHREQLAEQAAYDKAHPAVPPPPAPRPAPQPPTPEETGKAIAARPGLKKLELERVSADTVYLRITGRILLNGGCASAMPLFGVDMRTGSGWKERLALDPVQMDRGMPWVDWTDHAIAIPLAWWIRRHAGKGHTDLAPGHYRLFFLGADLKRLDTEAFTFGVSTPLGPDR